MNTNVAWFAAGLVLLILLASFAPKIAGGVVILLAVVLGISAANKGLL